MGQNTDIFDPDLNPVLEIANKEDLAILVDILLKKPVTEFLTTHKAYERHSPDRTKYADVIAAEIRDFGGNTFLNLFRGEGPSYYEITCDVAKKVKAPFKKGQDIETIEESIMLTILERAWEKMTDEEKQVILEAIGKSNKSSAGGFSSMAFQAVFRTGGFASYQLTVIIANAVVRAVLGRGLSFAANAALTRAMSVAVGPIGWAVTGIWTLVAIAGPSYKVTIPCIVQVAMMRKKYNAFHCPKCEAVLPNDSFKFCPECGEKLEL